MKDSLFEAFQECEITKTEVQQVEGGATTICYIGMDSGRTSWNADGGAWHADCVDDLID